MIRRFCHEIRSAEYDFQLLTHCHYYGNFTAWKLMKN